ncbi:MAG: alanine racemase [Phycisphaerales bacterium]|jgi:alanine racemase|nr:alanine racemase [Phycisphaerales bacterium]
MASSSHVAVCIDLARVRRNAEDIAKQTAVPIIAVVKADAYGLGAMRIAAALADLVQAFYVFDLREAVEYRLFDLTGKRTIALLGESDDPQDYLSQHVQPAVWTAERAAQLRSARPVLSVDTGQQRFACGSQDVSAVVRAGDIGEAFTHTSTLDQVRQFTQTMHEHGPAAGEGKLFLHAAGSSLLTEPEARLDAIRPGLALYRGAAHVSARLVEVRDSTGPAGYSGFLSPRHGVILAGYSHGLRPGPCLINGRRSRILEVGMQTSFVEAAAGDRVGDEVVLLGDALSEADVAAEWKTGPQEVLTRLCGAGIREYPPSHTNF